ncbi:DUF58 domain-containing protein [Pelagicoccus sp. SDUM812003]|uniref:DUF58 domain-containing protein n=1 Tax=Pelagicoccus sp. SDUM812003 TaxID=3041267 RepID=UPI00280FD791|nr:DUF58 domain-containing protein [Pelagicoccus sp. SDUM812003]MDQ8203301.1 DUF58 domain-containing protein [Pelagicoccus sp. SDUM812003]
MAVQVAEERFDWHGPAVSRRRRSLARTLYEQVVPPKGHKVVPTASGMLLIFIGLTIGLAAYNTVNNILFAALALLISALILSGVICWGNLLSARWRLETSTTFRVGEEGVASIVVENARQRFPLFCVSFGLASEATEKNKRLYLKERLNPGDSQTLSWRFKPEKRVRTRIRIENVVSSFPFGFLSKYLPGECEKEIIVWPRRINYSRTRDASVPGALQGRSSQKRGASGELIGLRLYEKGDALRSIHWKVSAKQGRLIVKQNAAETQAMFDILVDPADYLWGNEQVFEKMCSLAATLAEDLFLESKLNHCQIAGGPSIRIQRVSDLESFFDALADLAPFGSKEKPRFAAREPNRIVFKPIQKEGVGAYLNEIQIAQA